MMDQCIHCGDTVEFVFTRGIWMSATAMENCEICPKHADGHEVL